MKTEHNHYPQSKLWYIFICLCLLTLNIAPTSSASAEAESAHDNWQTEPPFGSDNCYPGTGWVWTAGPEQPETAQQAELSMAKEGIEATVRAFGFGEKDSCGDFELFATDF